MSATFGSGSTPPPKWWSVSVRVTSRRESTSACGCAPRRATCTCSTRPQERGSMARRDRQPRAPYRGSEVALAYLMLLPSLLVFGVFVFYPFVKDFQLPFFTAPPKFGAIARPEKYVGWKQWHD